MKKLIILLVLIFAFYKYVKADQYLSINSETAKRALILLANENEAIHYCPSCSDSSKESIINATFSYNDSWWGGKGIHIYGIGKGGYKWCSSVDLAYLFVKRGDKAVAVAELLELPLILDSTVSTVSTPFFILGINWNFKYADFV